MDSLALRDHAGDILLATVRDMESVQPRSDLINPEATAAEARKTFDSTAHPKGMRSGD